MYNVVIDRKVLRVGKNLHDFLRQLHSSSWRGYFWVDALCIDQTNTDERNSQVKIMADIYTRAETVHAWLGTGHDELRDWLTHIRSGGTLDDAHDFHIHLGELCKCAYWSRAWVVQELACATKILLHYGHEAIPVSPLWDNVFDSAFFKDWFQGDRKQLAHGLRRVVSILRRTQPNPDTELQPFESIIHDFSYQRCAEPRDHIYAFRSLYQDQYGDAVPVDYSISMPELISRALRCCETKTNLHSLFTMLSRWEISDEELSIDVNLLVVARICPQLPNRFVSPTEMASAVSCPLPPPIGPELELTCVRRGSSSTTAAQKYVFLPKAAAQMIRQAPPSSWCVSLLGPDYDLMVQDDASLEANREESDVLANIGGIAIVAQLEGSGSGMRAPVVGIWLLWPPFKWNREQYRLLRRLCYCWRILHDEFQKGILDGVLFEYTKRSEISVRMTLPSWMELSRTLQRWSNHYYQEKVFGTNLPDWMKLSRTLQS